MSDHFTTVTREALYEQVWSTPMMRLAKDYGVSGNALAKTCRKLGVPVPPRGHWAKLQHGKKTPPRPPLPAVETGTPVRATVSRSTPVRSQPPDPVIAICAKSLSDSGVKVAVQLLRPHPAVVAPRVQKVGAPDGSNVGVVRTLPMKVSKMSERRALLILDALSKALEDRGHVVTASGVAIEGELVPFAITEKDDRAPHVPTPAELARKKVSSWVTIPTWDYSPSGKLSIHSDCPLWNRRDVRRRWSDGRTIVLEDMLDDVLLGLVSVGVALRQQSEERRIQQELWAEEARQRAERERQVRLKTARDKNILADAKSLADAEEVRRLVAAVERRATKIGGPVPSDLEQWMARATSLANRLDPTASGVADMLTRHEEESTKEAERVPRWGG